MDGVPDHLSAGQVRRTVCLLWCYLVLAMYLEGAMNVIRMLFTHTARLQYCCRNVQYAEITFTEGSMSIVTEGFVVVCPWIDKLLLINGHLHALQTFDIITGMQCVHSMPHLERFLYRQPALIHVCMFTGIESHMVLSLFNIQDLFTWHFFFTKL